MLLAAWLFLTAAPTPSTDIAVARTVRSTQAFTWNEWTPAALARARKEKKIVLLDGAAEWCHWCHVMDETTYRDPRVGAWLKANAIAIRVDIDARPDFANRYGDWGWPATILLTGDGQELGKYRGYLEPARLLAILRALDPKKPLDAKTEPAGISVDRLPDAERHAWERLDFFWDEQEGSWGLKRKVPIGMNVLAELDRGTPEAIARADLTLTRQRVLIDPVWGGIYQYSAAADWSAPHFEKLASYQAANLEAAARGFLATKRASHLDDARAIHRYLVTHLRSPEGTFFTAQDADVNAHDRSKPFMSGHDFYALDEAGRKAVGSPWVDTHVYASENGRLLSALVAFDAVSGEGREDALSAARALLNSHVLDSGAVKHDAANAEKGPFFLDDAAALGLGLAQLGRAAHDPALEAAAVRIIERLDESFTDPSTGLLFDSTADPDAVGVFAAREHPFGANVTAARALAAIGKGERASKVLAALSGQERVDAEWAWVGDYLLALREVRRAKP